MGEGSEVRTRVRFDAIHTERVAQSSTTQRAGRAGRQGPGVAYRLWHEHEQSRRDRFSPPEITRADLAPLLLELAVWGVSSPAGLNWLDPLPEPHVAKAKELLRRLALIEPAGNPTPTGRAVAGLGVHPRLGVMLIHAAQTSSATAACRIAALLEEGNVWQDGPLDKPVDIEIVLDAMEAGPFCESLRRDVIARVKQAAQQYERRLKSLDGIARNSNGPLKAGALLALAYPERIGGGSRGKVGTFSGGGAAQLPAGDALAQSKYIVAADVDVSRQPAQIRLAGALLAKMWNRCSMNKSSDAKLSNGPRRPTRRCAIEESIRLCSPRHPSSSEPFDRGAKRGGI